MPGRAGIEIRSRVFMPEGNAEVSEPVKGSEKTWAARRARITKEDIRKVGLTEGCPGCRAVNRNAKYHEQHTEECRLRVETAMLDQKEEKYVRAEKRVRFKDPDEDADNVKRQRGEATASNDPLGSKVARQGGVVNDQDMPDETPEVKDDVPPVQMESDNAQQIKT